MPKAGSDGYKLPKKATVSLAAAKEVSTDAAVAVDGIFTLKDKYRTALKVLFGRKDVFASLLVQLNTVVHHDLPAGGDAQLM